MFQEIITDVSKNDTYNHGNMQQQKQMTFDNLRVVIHTTINKDNRYVNLRDPISLLHGLYNCICHYGLTTRQISPLISGSNQSNQLS